MTTPYRTSEQLDNNLSDPKGAVATGTETINLTWTPTGSGAAYLEYVTVHLSAIPTTSESLTVTLNANEGAAYDTILASKNFQVDGDQDFVYQPNSPLLLTEGDAIDVDFPNTDLGTYGVTIRGVER